MFTKVRLRDVSSTAHASCLSGRRVSAVDVSCPASLSCGLCGKRANQGTQGLSTSGEVGT